MTRSFPELTARPTLRVLSNEQIENMHLATLEVLERTGVQITHEKALELFDGAGAKIDRDRVRIPAAVIEKAIQQSQAPLVLGNRNGEIAVSLENGRSWFGAGLDCREFSSMITQPICQCLKRSGLAELLLTDDTHSRILERRCGFPR